LAGRGEIGIDQPLGKFGRAHEGVRQRLAAPSATMAERLGERASLAWRANWRAKKAVVPDGAFTHFVPHAGVHAGTDPDRVT
jgi:hypothetical protein